MSTYKRCPHTHNYSRCTVSPPIFRESSSSVQISRHHTDPYERFFFQQIITNPFLFLYKLINLYSIYSSIDNCALLLNTPSVKSSFFLRSGKSLKHPNDCSCARPPLFLLFISTRHPSLSLFSPL